MKKSVGGVLGTIAGAVAGITYGVFYITGKGVIGATKVISKAIKESAKNKYNEMYEMSEEIKLYVEIYEKYSDQELAESYELTSGNEKRAILYILKQRGYGKEE